MHKKRLLLKLKRQSSLAEKFSSNRGVLGKIFFMDAPRRRTWIMKKGRSSKQKVEIINFGNLG